MHQKRTHFVWCLKGKLFPKLLPFAILPFSLLSKPLVECDCAHLSHAETRCAWIQQRTSQGPAERWAKPDTPETHFWAVQKPRFELKNKIKSHVGLKSRQLPRPISEMGQSQGKGVLPYNLSMDKDLLLKVGLFSFFLNGLWFPSSSTLDQALYFTKILNEFDPSMQYRSFWACNYHLSPWSQTPK